MFLNTLSALAACATIAGFLLEVGVLLYRLLKGRKARKPDGPGGDDGKE